MVWELAIKAKISGKRHTQRNRNVLPLIESHTCVFERTILDKINESCCSILTFHRASLYYIVVGPMWEELAENNSCHSPEVVGDMGQSSMKSVGSEKVCYWCVQEGFLYITFITLYYLVLQDSYLPSVE